MSSRAADTLSQTTCKLTPITALLGVQVLCVAFGALVLVPTGLDPNVALFTAGIIGVIANLIVPGRARYP